MWIETSNVFVITGLKLDVPVFKLLNDAAFRRYFNSVSICILV